MTDYPRLVLPHFFTAAAALAFATGLFAQALPVPNPAANRVAAIAVRVAPDHADWTYAPGEAVKYHVSVTADNPPLAGAQISYKVGPEMMPVSEKSAVVAAGGFTIDGGTLTEPGFIRCVVTTEFGGKTYRGAANAGFAPEKIVPTQKDPEDFDAFWKAGLQELARTPVDSRRTLWPEACTDLITVYKVSFRTAGGGNSGQNRIYGVLCMPKAPGRHPALLSVPGAGVRPYGGIRDLAAKGVITLQIGIHGVPIDLPQEVYDNLGAGALSGYPTYNLDSRQSYYYRRVILGCVRANDYLASLPEFDGRNLAVTGSSQGGYLSIVTAALDTRVTALAAVHPAYCDLTGYLHGRAGGWPHMMRPNPQTGAKSEHATPEKIAVTGYYDGVNFARRIKVPSHFSWGYNDDVCPPTSMYSAYNVVTAEKQLQLALETAHNIIPEETEVLNAWLLAQLGRGRDGR